MIKKRLGNTGLEITPIGFGVLTIGKTQLNYPLEKGAELIRYALEKGINLLDTAQFYETYPYIKEALKNSAYNPVISSKCLHKSYNEMKSAVEEALIETDRSCIDIFMLHEVRGASDWESRAGAWECLREARAGGLVKAIGVSTHHVDVAEMCAGIQDIDVVFPLINYKSLGIRKGGGAGSRDEMAEAIKMNSEAGKGVLAMKVLGGGNLTHGYFDALDYVSGIPGVNSMMIGFGHPHEIDRIVEYAEGTIDRHYTPVANGKRMRIDAGDCIGCGACVEKCPNRAMSMNAGNVSEVDHSVCLTCGYCAPVCPVMAIIMF